MSTETKTIICISIITVLVIVGGFYFWNKSSLNNNVASAPKVFDRAEIVSPDSHIIGSISAKVIVTEFGDYECPACGAAYPVTKKIIEKYKDNKDVAFIFRNYPLPQHRNGLLSAQFVEAAGLQGKFWEMHDLVYQNQDKWSPMLNASDAFIEYAKGLNLDLSKIAKDTKSEKVAKIIQDDKNTAEKLGVDSTPTFFVNGVTQSGWGLDTLSKSIDTMLAE